LGNRDPELIPLHYDPPLETAQPVEPFIHRATIIFNNAQILALPTTPLTVAPAPGPGKAYLPLHAFIRTSIVTACVVASFGPDIDVGDLGLFPTLNLGLQLSGCTFIMPVVTGDVLENWENKPILLLSHDPTNYTGGNVANTFKVIVDYAIINP